MVSSAFVPHNHVVDSEPEPGNMQTLMINFPSPQRRLLRCGFCFLT